MPSHYNAFRTSVPWNASGYDFRMRVLPVLLLFLLALPVAAQDLETSNFADVEKTAADLVEKHGAQKVLIVLDIDNTLLTTDQALGGDAWFNWQAGLLREEPKSPHLVAKDFAGLLRVQGILFQLSGMHPPEKSIPAAVTRLQKTGAGVMAMTSRGPEYRDVTMRELAANGYDFNNGSPFGYPGRWLPTPTGLSAEETEKFGFVATRKVSYMSGVFLCSGQHKGGLLRMLFALRKLPYKAILFVDDHDRHSKRMREAWTDRGVELVTYRYARMDKEVQAFKDSDKAKVAAQWKKLGDAIRSIFG